MSELTLDEAIKHCIEVAENNEQFASGKWIGSEGEANRQECEQRAADHRQLAEWLMELKEAKSIIRVCNRVLGYLLEHEIESTSTRHEVETLLKNIEEYPSRGSKKWLRMNYKYL